MSEGLKRKYEIRKADGSPVDPRGVYFVLKLNSSDPVHAKASRMAAWAYANSVENDSRLAPLASDLFMLVGNLRQEAGEFDGLSKREPGS